MFRNNVERRPRRPEGDRQDDRHRHLPARLHAARPRPASPSTSFRAELRARLLAQYEQPRRGGIPWRRPATLLSLATLSALLICLGLMLVRPAPLSAAEIVQRATAARTVQVGDADVIYDRFRVTMPGGPLREAVVEKWQSPDKLRFRYQLSGADGALLYFVQRNGDRLWRSIHTGPVGSAPVTEVYQGKLEDSAATSPDDLAFSIGLSLLHPVWGHKLQCEDLQCLLQQRHGVARLLPRQRLPGGRTVHVVQIHYRKQAAGEPALTLTVKVDAHSYALVEVVEERDGQPDLSLTHFERRAVPAPAVPPGLFTALPPGVKVANGTFVIPRTNAMADRVGITSASIPPGTVLPEQAVIDVEVGYELVTAPKATLRVGYGAARQWIFVQQMEVTATDKPGVAHVRLRLDTAGLRDLLTSREVQLAASLDLSDGPQSFRVLGRAVSEHYRYLLPEGPRRIPQIEPIPMVPFPTTGHVASIHTICAGRYCATGSSSRPGHEVRTLDMKEPERRAALHFFGPRDTY